MASPRVTSRIGHTLLPRSYAKVAIGEKHGALKYLEKAVDNGWLYMDFLISSKEFDGMHGTSDWNRILEKIQKKLGERQDRFPRSTRET